MRSKSQPVETGKISESVDVRRRQALRRLGLGVATAYAAPTVLKLHSVARASNESNSYYEGGWGEEEGGWGSEEGGWGEEEGGWGSEEGGWGEEEHGGGYGPCSHPGRGRPPFCDDGGWPPGNGGGHWG